MQIYKQIHIYINTKPADTNTNTHRHKHTGQALRCILMHKLINTHTQIQNQHVLTQTHTETLRHSCTHTENTLIQTPVCA